MTQIIIENAEQMSPRELVEAIWEDQQRRVAVGQEIRAEKYLARFPGLRDEPECAVDVVYGEFVARASAGQALDVREFFQRFPQYRDQLDRQFHIHDALNSAVLKSSPQPKSSADASSPGSLDVTVASTVGIELPEQGPQTTLSSALAPDRFEILEEIGRGGMGVVYKAQQKGLNRLVALKMILAGAHAGEELLARFQTEAEAVAKLQHPNIVQIYEIGRHDDRPYFALEYVPGGTLRERLSGTPLPPREAAELMEQLARAADYAHQHGVVHRDLKPANILLEEAPEQAPGSQTSTGSSSATRQSTATTVPALRAKITDFGLAKQTEVDSGQTRSDAVIGTPSYMAPEQAAGHAKEVGPLADVYALGAILYETLTGRPPFKSATLVDTLQQVQLQEPIPPRRFQAAIPRDLETICLKCLEKEPSKRYASAAELADELQRFLNGEPILARPISTSARLWRWARRSPLVAGLTATALLLLVAVAVVGMVGYMETMHALGLAEERELEARSAQQTAEQQRDAADKAREAEVQQRRLAETTLADMHTSFGLAAGERGDPQEAALWFASAAERAQHDPERVLANRVRFGAWSRQFPLLFRVLRGGAWIQMMAFHASGRYLIVRGSGVCRIWDLETGQPALLRDGPEAICAGAWSPKGDRLAVGTWPNDVAILTFPEGKLLQRFSPVCRIQEARFSADGRRLAVQWDNIVRVWDCETGTFATPLLGHPENVLAFSFNSTGTRLATTCADNFTRVFAVAGKEVSAEPLFTPVGRTTRRSHVPPPRFVHGDRLLVAQADDCQYGLWDAETGVPVRRLPLGGPHFTVFKVTPDGKALLFHGDPREFGLRAIPSGERLFEFDTKDIRHIHGGAAFSPAGDVLVTVSDAEHVARIWSVPAQRQLLSVPFPGKCASVAISPDGRFFAVHAHGGGDEIVCVWGLPDLQDDRRVHPMGYSRRYARAALSADGSYVAPAGYWSLQRTQWTVRAYDVARGEPAGPHIDVDGLNSATFSPSGAHLATLSSLPQNRHITNPGYQDPLARGRVRVWDWRQGQLAWPALESPSRPARVAYSPDGGLLVVLCAGGEILLIDPATGQVRMRLDQSEKQGQAELRIIGGVWFTSDGARFVTGGLNKVVRVWESSSGRLCHTFTHDNSLRSVGLSKDDELLATGTAGKGIATAVARVWDLATGQRVGAELPHPNAISFVDFSPDGQYLLTACMDGMVRVWDWRTGKLACPALEHEDATQCARFSRDGRWILAAGGHCLRMWEWQTGRQIAPARQLSGESGTVLVTPNGESAVVDGRRMLWIRIFDLRDLARPPHQQLSLSELRALSELVSTRRIEGAGTTRMTSDEWFQRWQSLQTTWLRTMSVDGFRTTLSDFAKAALVAQGAHRAFHEEAEELFEAREYEKAIAAYSRALYLRPDDARALQERGLAYDEGLGQLEKGLADYNRALQLDPYYPRAYGHRALIYARRGQLEKALADATQAVRTSYIANLANYCTLRADVLALLDRWDEVAEEFVRYVEYASWYRLPRNWPEHAALRLHLAGVDEYRRMCSELVKRFGATKVTGLASVLAWTCALGPKAVPDLTRCIALAEMAVAAQPESHIHRYALGAVLYRHADFVAAVEHLNKSIELHGEGGSAEAWLFLAMSHHRLKRPEEARRWLEKATQWIDEHMGYDDLKAASETLLQWGTRLRLTLLQEEAQRLLSGGGSDSQDDVTAFVKDPERLRAIIKTLDDALETTFRKEPRQCTQAVRSLGQLKGAEQHNKPSSASLEVPPWALPSDAPAPAVAPFDAATARRHQQAWAEYLRVPAEMTNSIGMKLVLIPPGELIVGSDIEEIQSMIGWNPRASAEGPRHRVRITRPFYLGRHEVTLGQFRAFVQAGKYRTEAESDRLGGRIFEEAKNLWPQRPDINWRSAGFAQTDEHPVVQVSWNDCLAFCRWLSEKEGKTYALPTEAQWEHACRAGSMSRWCSGDDEALAVKYAWCNRQGGNQTKPVGQKLANGFGLLDVHGNVREWCHDWYSSSYYDWSAFEDPAGPAVGSLRVTRGGGWCYGAVNCRSADRQSCQPSNRFGNLGFRVALTLPDDKVDGLSTKNKSAKPKGGPPGPEAKPAKIGPKP